MKDATARQPPPFVAPLLFGGAMVIVLVAHLATNGNLGFHTDELYSSIPAGTLRSGMSTSHR